MNRVIKSSLLLAILFFSNLGYTMQLEKPNKCPSAKSIQTAGFDAIRQDSSENWTVFQRIDYYDTNVVWTFYTNVQAENENAAMKKATNALQSLYLYSGPLKNYDDWGCIYLNDLGIVAFAVSPPINTK